MDKTALVGIDIEGGDRLLEALDKADFDIRAALWFYSSDPDRWRLVVASPFVDQNGPKKAYTLIQSELEKVEPPPRIDLEHISVLGMEHRLVKALLKADAIYPTGTVKWLNGILIGDVFIEAAYIYRLKS